MNEILNIELFAFEGNSLLKIAEAIIKHLQEPNNLTTEQKEFWTQRGLIYTELATISFQTGKGLVEIYGSNQTKNQVIPFIDLSQTDH